MAAKRSCWIGQVIEGKAMTKSTRACQAYSLARFGKTYAYIGEILGVSRQRAHQMVKSQAAKFGELAKRKTGFKPHEHA